MEFAQPEQREREADGVVEVAARREHRVVAVMHAQDRGDHLLHGGLAVAAHHDDHRQVEAATPVRSELAQRGERVVDGDERAARAVAAAGVDERGSRARGEGVGDEVVTVEAFALERDEQIARLDRTAVRGHARERGIGTDEAPAQHRSGDDGLHHAAPRAASAPCAASPSENGVRTPFRSWYVS